MSEKIAEIKLRVVIKMFMDQLERLGCSVSDIGVIAQGIADSCKDALQDEKAE